MFKNFYKMLKPGGLIITEMPNLNGILRLLFLMPKRPFYKEKFKNRDIIKSQLYGASWERNEKGYPYHKYIWDKTEFSNALRDIGFEIILSTGATKSHVPLRDMAIICQKPCTSKNEKYSNELALKWRKNYGNLLHRSLVQVKSILKLLLLSIIR